VLRVIRLANFFAHSEYIRLAGAGQAVLPFDAAGRPAENRGVPMFGSPVLVVAATLGLGALAMSPVTPQRPPLRDGLHRSDVKALAAGALLVSARRLPDPNFANTVILLVDYGHEGAVGLVVNRRSDATLGRLFPNLKPSLATAGRAFFGGPVQKTQAMALVRAPEAPARARHVVDGIHLVSAREAVEALVASDTASSRYRVYFGYAGWSPGQLEAETAEGVWHVLGADAGVVFAEDPSTMWPQQIARTEMIQARRSAARPHPSRVS
jgi:putative transcriptional regulator